MTAVLALNLVLDIVVVAALLRLLSWAIISSPSDQLVNLDVREPARRPYAPRSHAPHPHRPSEHRAQPSYRVPVSD